MLTNVYNKQCTLALCFIPVYCSEYGFRCDEYNDKTFVSRSLNRFICRIGNVDIKTKHVYCQHRAMEKADMRQQCHRCKLRHDRYRECVCKVRTVARGVRSLAAVPEHSACRILFYHSRTCKVACDGLVVIGILKTITIKLYRRAPSNGTIFRVLNAIFTGHWTVAISILTPHGNIILGNDSATRSIVLYRDVSMPFEEYRMSSPGYRAKYPTEP